MKRLFNKLTIILSILILMITLAVTLSVQASTLKPGDKVIKQTTIPAITVKRVNAIIITDTFVNTVPNLPQAVSVTLTNNRVLDAKIIWSTNALSAKTFELPGTVTITGKLTAYKNYPVSAKVNVKEPPKPTITGIEDIIIPDTIAGTVPVLPKTVNVKLSNNSSTEASITWNSDATLAATYCAVGTVTINGSLNTYESKPVSATVNIAPPPIVDSYVDTDGDGLNDYQEIHKYFTDPNKSDTDGNGIPDGDLNERTKHTYVIKVTMRIKKPYNLSVMNDNYQDAQLVSETSDYGVFNITLFPYNTNDVTSNANWQSEKNDPNLKQYLQPTICANWDDSLRSRIVSDLKAAGIDIDKLDDAEVVQRASQYLCSHIEVINMFDSYYTYFPKGIPTIFPGLEDAFQIGKGNPAWTTEDQFNHELYGKQMYLNSQRGTCTSTAVLWETVFRAIGIPSRMILSIPIIDSNDNNQNVMISNITDRSLAGTVQQGLKSAQGFAAHTYLEVYVGNNWVRLNDANLGQNIIDPACFGALIHINTFNDLSYANLIPWGKRYALGKLDSFKYANPYETSSISSDNGVNSKLAINQPKILSSIKIQKMATKDSSSLPDNIKGVLKSNSFIIGITSKDNNFFMDEISSFIKKDSTNKTFLLKDANGNILTKASFNKNYNGWFNSIEGYYVMDPDDINIDFSKVVTVDPENSTQWTMLNNKLFH